MYPGVPMFECWKPSQSWKHAIAHVNCGARGGLAEWGIVPPHHHPVTSPNTNTHKHTQIQIHIEIQILVEWGIIPPQQHPVTYSNTKLYVADKENRTHQCFLSEKERAKAESFVLALKKLFWQIKRQLDVLVHSLTRYFPLGQLEWEEQWNVPSGFLMALKGETAHCNQFELASSPLTPPCSFIVLLIWY